MPGTPSQRSQIGFETVDLKLGKDQQPENTRELQHPERQAMRRGRKDRNRAANRVARRARRASRR